MNKNGAIFCTTRLDMYSISYLERWVEFYKEWGFDLFIFNDGEVPEGMVVGGLATVLGFEGGSLGHIRGWTRSFLQGSLLLLEKGYDRVIHCEADAFVVSERLKNHMFSWDMGWHILWCPRRNFAESAVQVVHNSAIEIIRAEVKKYVESNYHVKECVEKDLKYTTIHKEFVGDRYGETIMKIPTDVDYICQARLSWRPKHEDRDRIQRDVGDLMFFSEFVMDKSRIEAGGYSLEIGSMSETLTKKMNSCGLKNIVVEPIYFNKIPKNEGVLVVKKAMVGREDVEHVEIIITEAFNSTHIAGIDFDKFVQIGPNVKVEAITIKKIMMEQGIEQFEVIALDCEGSEELIIPSLVGGEAKQIVMELHTHCGQKNETVDLIEKHLNLIGYKESFRWKKIAEYRLYVWTGCTRLMQQWADPLIRG